MGLLDHFRGRRAAAREPEAPARPVVRPPTGFLSWVMLTDPDGLHVPCILRRLLPSDVMPLSLWPSPTYFDWLGLVDSRPSGRPTRATVNYDKPLRLEVMETLPFAGMPAEIVGAMALCERPKERQGHLELAYLEKSPDSRLRGFGMAALALAVQEARQKDLDFFLDALIKSSSHLFYRRCGMREVDGTPWPTVTVRMEFPGEARADAFVEQAREQQLIP
jgi:GNAT superfamily N-acetyltransferase